MTGVIYARYSSDKQTENSILGQVRECKVFAEKEGIEVINIYKDEAISGRTAIKRPAFLKMISDAEKHMFDCIIVWKGDRFSRSRADAAKYKSELKKLGIRVLSATEANVTGPEAVLMDGINEAFAEYFSVELAAKVERGMTQNAIDGRYNGGRTTLGYKVVNGVVMLDEEIAPIIKEFFELYADDVYSVPQIMEIFDRKGYKYNGHPFKRSTLFRAIRNPRYYGHYEFKGTVNDNIYPAIVSKETWEKARAKAEMTHRKSISYKAKQDYILSGKLICGECLTYFIGDSAYSRNGTAHYYYTCPGKKHKGCTMERINKANIEDAIVQAVIDLLWSKKDIERYVRIFMNAAKETVNKQSEHLAKALRDTKKSIANITAAIELGANFEALIPRLNQLMAIQKEQEKDLQRSRIESGAFDEESLRRFLDRLKLRNYISTDERKFLVEMFIDTIYLYKDKTMRILLNFGGTESYKSVRLESRLGHHCINILNTIDLSDTEFELYRIQRDKSQ